MNTKNLKWFQKKSVIIISLILFFPLGLYFMWKYSDYWSKKTKILITIGILIMGVIGYNNPSNSSSSNTSSSNKCLLNGCDLEGKGWVHDSQSSEMKSNNLFGVYRIQESGGYCTREHGFRDN